MQSVKHLSLTLSRKKFEELIEPLLDRLRPPLERALIETGIDGDDISEVLLVGGSTRIPKVLAIVAEYFERAPIRFLHNEVDIALGAARQAQLLDSGKDSPVRDVLPLSIGIETIGGVFTKVFERNTPLPASMTQIFSTAEDNQTSVEVHILQGEQPRATDNRSLGKFLFSGIPPMPRGMPQIEIVMSVDAGGVISVSAKDLSTGRVQEATWTESAGLSVSEVDRLRQEAAPVSEQNPEVTDMRHRILSLVIEISKRMRSADFALDPDTRRFAQSTILEADKASRRKDLDEMKRALRQLELAMEKLTKSEHAQFQVAAEDSVSTKDVDTEFDLDVEG